MIILSNYQVRKKNGIFYVVTQESAECPKCGNALSVRDSKRRHVIMTNGNIQTFLLRRLKCRACNAIHLELPDLFVPYKRYSRQVIDMALAGSLSSCPAENSTIYRWNKERTGE